MGLSSSITAKNKVSTCLTTRLLTISLGKSTCGDWACTGTDIFFSRQAMSSTKAWQRHGCYHLGAEALYGLPLTKATLGCKDDWNSLDHFDPTADLRRLFKQFFDLRAAYGVLNDGFSLFQHGNWTHEDFLPFSNGSVTERGLWSVSRGGLTQLQNFTYNDTVWFLYTNENSTLSYSGSCTASSGIAGPYQSDTIVQNLFYPFENWGINSPQSQNGVRTGVSHFSITKFSAPILTNHRACAIRLPTISSSERARRTTSWCSQTLTTTRPRSSRAAIISYSPTTRSEPRS